MQAPTQPRTMPKDAAVIVSILQEIGITEYEPRVVNQLLEFTNRYVTTVLEDAKAYSNHAKKKTIDLEDVRLAIHMQLDKTFTNPQSRDLLLEVARIKNSDQLPLVKPHFGIRLPPDRYCLNGCNYRLKSTVPKKFIHSTMSVGNYGMKQGSVTLAGKAPQLQLVKRPVNASLMTVPRTQSISAPKPVIKLSPAGIQGHRMVAPKPKVQIPTAGQHIEVATVHLDVESEVSQKRELDGIDCINKIQGN